MWPFLLVLGLLLGGCSTHTTTLLTVKLEDFVPQDRRSGTLNLLSREATFPGPQGEPISLPPDPLRALVEARLEARVSLENRGTSPVGISLEARVGPEGDTNLFDGNGDRPLGQPVSLTLGPQGSGDLNLQVLLKEGDGQSREVLELIRGGRFRIGLRLTLSVSGSSQVGYTLHTAHLALGARLFRLVP